MKLQQNGLYAAMFSAMIGLAGCSSSNNADTLSAANITGRITGFGSVYVDGVEFETNGTTITIDGVPASESDLHVGMLVNLTGSDDGKNGNATSISFEDEVEGVVTQTEAGGGLEVMGLAITVDNSTNLDGFAAITDLAVGDTVEISGYPDGNGGIHATYIESQGAYTDGNEIEVKGLISNLDVDSAGTLYIGTMKVDYSNADLSEAGTLADGLYVEVKSITAPDAVSGILTASKVELEDGGDYGVDGNEGEELEVEGLITAIDTVSVPNTISVNGQTFDIPAGIDISGFAAGDLIDLDIEIVGGVPTITELEEDGLDDDAPGKIEVKSIVSATDTVNNTITIAGITISVDPSKTIMMDHSSTPDQFFNLGAITEGVDHIKVEAIPNATGDGYIALSIERTSSTSTVVELEGTVSIDTNTGVMTIAGVTLDIATNSVTVPAGVADGVEIHANGTIDVDGILVVTVIELS